MARNHVTVCSALSGTSSPSKYLRAFQQHHGPARLPLQRCLLHVPGQLPDPVPVEHRIQDTSEDGANATAKTGRKQAGETAAHKDARMEL